MTTTLVKNQTTTYEKTIQYDGRTCTMKVEIRHDDQCGNGHNTFSITADIYAGEWAGSWLAGGCMHDEIREHFPELSHLIEWHLCSTDGPMHYIKNTTYLASDRDCWGRRKGEPSHWDTRIRFGDAATSHPIKPKFAEFLEASRVEDLHICEYSSDEPERFSPHYTFGGFGAAWHECPFRCKADAVEWLKALQTDTFAIEKVPTAFSDGKEPKLDAARSAAIWPDATLEQLTDEDALRERLPALLARFRNAVESLGMTY